MTAHPAAVGQTPRRRRRWPWVLLIVVVLAGVLVVAGEVIARAVVPQVVRAQVVQALELPDDQDLEVEAEGVLLPQLLTGTLNALHLSSDAVDLGELTGSVEATATDVPVRGGEIGGITGTLRIEADQFTGLLAVSDIPLERITLGDGVVTLEGTVPVFLVELPVKVGVEPSVRDGDILLRPSVFEIGGAEVDISALAERLGGFGGDLTGPYTVCIADRMPAGIALTDITVAGGAAVFDVSVEGRITVDEALQQLGSCG